MALNMILDTDMQNGYGHGYAAWTWTSSGHGHAAWTRTCRMDMDMQHEHGYVAWTFTCTMDIGMKNGD
jgi:hypothetical protein